MHLLGKNGFLLGDIAAWTPDPGNEVMVGLAASILPWRLKSLLILIDHSDTALSGALAFLAKGPRA